MMPIDTESLVPVQEEAAQTEGAPPSQAVAHEIDFDSLTIDAPEKVQQDAWTRAVSNSEKPGMWETIRNILLPQISGAARIASDLGAVDYKIAPPTPIAEQRQQHIDFIAGAAGVPSDEVAKYYDNFRALADVTTHGIISSIENVSAAVPLPSSQTVEGIVNATMTPAITAAALSNPVGTAAGLLFFTGLDHIAPTPVIKGATPDQQATVNLVGMFVKGLATAGLMHRGARAIDPLDKMGNDWGLGDLYEQHLREKLRANGMPDVITLAPEQVQAIRNIDAENKVQRKNDARREKAVNDVASDILNKRPIQQNVAVEIVRDARQRIVDDINAKKGRGEKITNREQQLRYDLQRQLDADPTGSIVRVLDIGQAVSDTAAGNELSVKIPAENLVKVALDSQENFDKVTQILNQAPAEKRTISEKAYQEARQRQRESVGKLRTGIDPKDVKDLVIIGAYHFENGIISFEAWSKKMLEEHPDAGPKLEAVWKELKKKNMVMVGVPGNIGKYLTQDEAGKKPNKRTIAEIRAALEELPKVEEFVESAKAGMAKRGWDHRASETIKALVGEDSNIFADLVAATSLQQQVAPNWRMATSLYKKWLDAGRPTDAKEIMKVVESVPGAKMAARAGNIIRAFNGERLSGIKIENWSRALKGDPEAITNDLWIARFADLEEGAGITKSQHNALNIRIRQAAEKLGWSPAETSETIWSFVKYAHEKGKIGKAIINEDYIKSITGSNLKDAPEYALLLRDPKIQETLLDINITQEKINDIIATSEKHLNEAEAASGKTAGDTGVLTRVAKRLQKNAQRYAEARVAEKLTPADPKDFHKAIKKADKNSEYRGFVTVYPPEEYAKMKTFLNPDHTAGYAITPDNEIASVFNKSGVPGVGLKMLKEAIEKGGNHLYAFDGFLTGYYKKLGFSKEVERFAFDDKMAPEGWDYARNQRPDVVHLKYDKSQQAKEIGSEGLRQGDNPRVSETPGRAGQEDGSGAGDRSAGRVVPYEDRLISDQAYEQSLQNLKEKTSGLKSGVDPTAAADLAIIGGYHIESGIREFPEWSKKMREDVGKLSEETLKKVWDDLHIAPQFQPFGEQRQSGLATSVEAKAVEKKLTKGFEGTSEYEAIDMKDQAAKATELVTRSPLIAYRVAMGLENAPGDLRAHSVYVAMENQALKNGDVNTLRDLATMSSLNKESSGAAQTLRILAERDPSSPVSAIKDLTKTREEVVKKRVKNIEKAKADIAAEIKREIKKPKQTKASWAAFAESLRC